jgi:hypothetical protein
LPYASWGKQQVKKLLIALTCCGSLVCSAAAAHAKTFVGVLWPMFGPLPAIGIVELVAEIRSMPDVEVVTYLHQSWPSLVEDIKRQPPGTRIAVVGYSLGANSTAFVANSSKYVDLIIALQPSMLSWNPKVSGKVGRMIEVYNPNPLMTFGGMGSKKLEGENIEYIANNDSHPGAQFNSDFRSLVKREIGALSTKNDMEAAQPRIIKTAYAVREPEPVQAQPLKRQPKSDLVAAQARITEAAYAVREPEPAQEQTPKNQLKDSVAFLDALSSSVDSGDLSVERRLTTADIVEYAQRTYRVSPAAANFERERRPRVAGDVVAAYSADPDPNAYARR